MYTPKLTALPQAVARNAAGRPSGYSSKGGCSRRGVQWMGVALYNNTAYNLMHTTTPCFHCTPL